MIVAPSPPQYATTARFALGLHASTDQLPVVTGGAVQAVATVRALARYRQIR